MRFAPVLLLALCGGCTRPLTPNFLFVIVDEMGVDKAGVYGFPGAPSTPTLDGLAEQGLRFDNAYVTPLCGVTRAALLTGRMPSTTGFGHNPVRGSNRGLSTDEVSAPRVLAEAGYTSEVVGKWHLIDRARDDAYTHPQDMGFAHHHGTIANIDAGRDDNHGTYTDWERVVDGQTERNDRYATEVVAEDAQERLAVMTEPWFLWTAFQAAHKPLHTPPAALLPSNPPLEDDADRFDATLEAVDTALGQILEAMDPEVRSRTVVVVIGDNGTIQEGVRAPLDPERHKGSLYEGGVKVPLLLSGPEVPVGVSQALVHGVDLLPTLAELAGLRVSKVAPLPLDGRSLVPVLEGAPDHRDVVWTERLAFGDERRMIRDPRHKLIRRTGEADQFFDLEGRRYDDGPDLMPDLTPVEQAAKARLGSRLDAALGR